MAVTLLTTKTIIDEAFERIGVEENMIVGQKRESARRSLNLLIYDLANKGLALFLMRTSAFQIISGQKDYRLPVGTVDVMEDEVVLTNAIRQLNSPNVSTYTSCSVNPEESRSTAFLAFDENPDSVAVVYFDSNFYTFTWISYQFVDSNLAPKPVAVKYVGIEISTIDPNDPLVPVKAQTYSLRFTVGDVFDPNPANIVWEEEIELFPGYITWFVIPDALMNAQFNVIETTGKTLVLKQLYFATEDDNQRQVGAISRFDYLSYPNKKTQENAIPYSYTIQRVAPPIMTLFPAPTDPQYSLVVYNRKKEIEDIESYINSPDIPPYYIDAIIAQLAFRLAEKYAPDRIEVAAMKAKDAIEYAIREDKERVKTTIKPRRRGYAGYQ